MTNDDAQPSLFDDEPHAHARRHDPWTSHEAAASITSDKIRASQRAVITVFQRCGPMTHTDLIDRYARMRAGGWALPSQSPSGLRTRCCELVERGHIKNSGQVVTLESGRRAIIWELAP